MTRPLRIEYEGALYHVTSRGNNYRNIFFTDSDRESLLSILGMIKKRYALKIHAYCLMDNHYHLLIETPRANLSESMRQINGIYTMDLNKRHRRVGHVFQGRYKANICDKDSYFLVLIRYIVRNPVAAGIADDVAGYRWTSFSETVSEKEETPVTEPGLTLSYFSTDHEKAIELYRDYVNDGRDPNIWENLKGGFILGSDDFAERVGKLVQEEISHEIKAMERYPSRPSLSEVFSGNGTEHHERNALIAKAHERYGYKNIEIADHLGLHYSTISNILKKERGQSKR